MPRLLVVGGLLLALYGGFVFFVGVLEGDWAQAAVGFLVGWLGARMVAWLVFDDGL